MSKLIVLEGPQGRREIPQGPDGQYRFTKLPGEKVVGSREKLSTLWEQANSPEGLGVGDLVAAGTRLVGLKPCAPCNKRHNQWNKYRIKI